jgi:hypothetical protein
MSRSNLTVAGSLVLVLVSCVKKETASPDGSLGDRQSVFVPSQDVTLAQQTYSGDASRQRLVVQSANEWPSIWAKMHEGQSPEPAVVTPDFNSEDAVIAAMGEQNSGGYTITIDSVTRHERGSIVYVTEKSPSSSCITPAVITHPVHAVRAPRSTGTYQWRERSLTVDC